MYVKDWWRAIFQTSLRKVLNNRGRFFPSPLVISQVTPMVPRVADFGLELHAPVDLLQQTSLDRPLQY